MVQCLLVALVGGWLMAQQPPMVTQTELPPPVAAGASAAKPAPSAQASSTAKEPAQTPNEQASDKKSAETEKKASESTRGKEIAPSSESSKQSTGGRVAAFWIILPGK